MPMLLLFVCGAVIAVAQVSGDQAAELERYAEQLFQEQQWPEAARAASSALAANPRSVNGHLILGLIATGEGRRRDARIQFENAAALRPRDLQITGYLAAALFQEGRVREAEPLFRRVLAGDPSNRAAHFNLGLLLLQRGAATEAETHFLLVSHADPSDIAALAGMLECRLIRRDQPGAADAAHELNTRLAPANPERLRIALLLIRYRSWDLAIEALQPIPADSPPGLEARYDLALAHFRAGRSETAADVIVKEPHLLDEANAQHLLGDIQENLGNLDAAEKAFDRAALLDPGDENTRFDQAVFRLEHQDIQMACQTFQTAVSAFPNSWRMRLGLSAAEYLAGDAAQAAGTLVKLVNEQPNAKLAYSMLGSLYEQVPDAQERIYQALERYLKTAPRDAPAYAAFGKILLIRAKTQQSANSDHAAPYLRRAIALDPSIPEPYLDLATISENHGELQGARKLLERAASIAPEAAEPHYRLARLYEKLGREHDAVAETERFRDLKTRTATVQGVVAGLKNGSRAGTK